MKIALVIVSFNSYEDIISLLNSLNTQLRKPDNIIIIDNCSPNGDGIKLKELSNKSWFTCIITEKNWGFAYWCNIGTEYAVLLGVTHVGYINPDSVIKDQNFLFQIEEAFLTSEYGIIGTYVIQEQTKKVEFGWSKILPFFFYPVVQHKGDSFLVNQVLKIHETDYTTGSSLFFPVSILKKVGKMDESYFLYFEETDWCLRVRNIGYKIGVISSTCIEHKTSGSVGFRSKIYTKYMIRNYAKFALEFMKWYEFPIWFLLYILFWVPGQLVSHLYRKYL